MTSEEYQEAVMRTCGAVLDTDRFLMAGLGIAGEAGEIADLVKKVRYHDHKPNGEKFVEELGDLLWYTVVMCEALGVTLEDVMKYNIEKLQKRYPDGFDAERSKNRI